MHAIYRGYSSQFRQDVAHRQLPHLPRHVSEVLDLRAAELGDLLEERLQSSLLLELGSEAEVGLEHVPLHLESLGLERTGMQEPLDCVPNGLKHARLLVLQAALSERVVNQPLDLLVGNLLLVELDRRAD